VKRKRRKGRLTQRRKEQKQIRFFEKKEAVAVAVLCVFA
jgi:hypothetical protein